jgi:DNA-binding response OmpR family regulator
VDTAKRILLIEDDKDTSDLYADVFTEAGYGVVTAVDGEDGLKKAQQGGFALILLDVMMPKMDGLAFLTAYNQAPPAVANGPIILLTNLTHDSVIKEAMSLGAKGYIIKSDLNPGELLAKVQTFLA